MENKHIPGLLGPDVGYVDLMDHNLLEVQARELAAAEKSSPLRPSAAGACGRQLAYRFKAFREGVPYEQEERKPNIIRLLKLGHAVENLVIREMEQIEFFKIKYKQQMLSFFKIGEREFIEGSNDLCVYIPGHRAIADVKTKGDKFYFAGPSQWDGELEKLSKMSSVQSISDNAFWVDDLEAFLAELDDDLFADNFYQLNLYAMNPFMQERGIDHAFILRYNKNNSKLMEVRFRPSQAVYEKVKNKFELVARTIDAGMAPDSVPRDFLLGSQKCAYCPNKAQCWPNDNALKAFFETFPKKEWPTDTDRMADEHLSIQLEELYARFLVAEPAVAEHEKLSDQIAKLMTDHGFRKVRFQDGHVYEAKQLKERISFRRSKA